MDAPPPQPRNLADARADAAADPSERDRVPGELVLYPGSDADRLTGDRANSAANRAGNHHRAGRYSHCAPSRERRAGGDDGHHNRDHYQQYLPERAALVFFRLGRDWRCGRGVADYFAGVVGFEGAGVVGVLDRPGGQDQALAFAQRGVGAHAVGFGDLVPQRSVAPQTRGDRLQAVALAHGVAAAGRALIIRIDRRDRLRHSGNAVTRYPESKSAYGADAIDRERGRSGRCRDQLIAIVVGPWQATNVHPFDPL